MTPRRRLGLAMTTLMLLAGGAAANIAIAWAIALAPRTAATRFATDFGPSSTFDSVGYAREHQTGPPVVHQAAARGPGYERCIWSMHQFGEFRIWNGRGAIGVPLHRAATVQIEEITGAWGLMQPHRAYWLDGADGVEEAFGWPLPALHGAWLRDADYTTAWRTRGGIPLQRPATSAAGGLLPLLPLPGFAINTLLYTAALAAPLLALSRLRAHLRARRGRCRNCGYDTTGLPRCPECGAARGLAPPSRPESAP